MTYINFITGLIIAAVLSVPGAMQHEATQVEEKLVMEGNITIDDDRWILVDVSGDHTDPNNQVIMAILDANASPQAPCTDNSGTICAVKLDLSSVSNPSSLLNQTVYQATTTGGADYPTSGQEYSFRDTR